MRPEPGQFKTNQKWPPIAYSTGTVSLSSLAWAGLKRGWSRRLFESYASRLERRTVLSASLVGDLKTLKVRCAEVQRLFVSLDPRG